MTPRSKVPMISGSLFASIKCLLSTNSHDLEVDKVYPPVVCGNLAIPVPR